MKNFQRNRIIVQQRLTTTVSGVTFTSVSMTSRDLTSPYIHPLRFPQDSSFALPLLLLLALWCARVGFLGSHTDAPKNLPQSGGIFPYVGKSVLLLRGWGVRGRGGGVERRKGKRLGAGRSRVSAIVVLLSAPARYDPFARLPSPL